LATRLKPRFNSSPAFQVGSQKHLGGRDFPQLALLLACLIELLPWLKQWRNRVSDD
jgi:hypothetical protein